MNHVDQLASLYRSGNSVQKTIRYNVLVLPEIMGRGYVISNVYKVYLSCEFSCDIVILYNCCIDKRKIEGLQGSVAHVSTLVYPLHLGSTQVDVVCCSNSSTFFMYSSLFMTTSDTPLSTVRITLVLSFLKLLRWWEKLECKMAIFKNHRRFSLRCLKQDVIPVGIKMKTNVKTPRGLYIVKRAEKALLNKRIRSVSNMINMLKMQIDTCMEQLKTYLEERVIEECKLFINSKRESRHNSTLVRQLHKFERLCHKNKIQGGHSNYWEKQDGHSNIREEGGEKHQKWVINISDTPLTEAQEKLLAHGPNYAVVPKHPPTIEVITSIEKTCQNMVKGEAEELKRGGQGHLQEDTTLQVNYFIGRLEGNR